MAEDGGPPLKRPKLHRDEIEKLSRDDLLQRLLDQEIYIESLQNKTETDTVTGGEAVTDPEDKLKQQQVDATRRENVLVMRLTTKEQDLQEYINQIQELKQVKNSGTIQLRAMLLDPAINLMFQRMRREMDSCKEKLEQAQNDLAAWKFTPDSQTGKRLMAKCRMLLQENEELGKMISAGRTAKLEGEIALEKKFVEEMKKSQAETDEFLEVMDEDTEGLQSTIYFLQHELKEAKDEVVRLREENAQLCLHQEAPQLIVAARDRDSIEEEEMVSQNTPRTLHEVTSLGNGRTSNDDNVVSSSSPDGTARSDLEQSKPHSTSTHDSRQSPTNANGEHVPMETEGPQSSSDAHRQDDGSPTGSTPKDPSSPHTHYKLGAYSTSPTPTDSTNQDKYRTEATTKTLPDRMQNGMLSKQLPVESETK